MKPDNIYLRKLHINAVEKTAKYLTAEAELIEALDEVEKYRAFIRLGYGSLWTYCTEALKLSESVAASFIGVMRKSREVPELKAAIRAGDFSVSKARKIVSVITPENKQTWIELCKTLPCKKLEKEVVHVNPKEAIREGARSVQENRIKLTIGVSEELYKKFQRAQDILCQRTQQSLNYEATLEQIVEFFVEKVDPIRKAQRAIAKTELEKGQRAATKRQRSRAGRAPRTVTKENLEVDASLTKTRKEELENPEECQRDVCKLVAAKNGEYKGDAHNNSEGSSRRSWESAADQLFTRTVKLRFTRRSINREQRSQRKNLPAEVRHTVILRDGNRCTHTNTRGLRCAEKKWLDFHHIHPVSQGGKDNPENVTILCRSHHAQHHERENFLASFFETNLQRKRTNSFSTR